MLSESGRPGYEFEALPHSSLPATIPLLSNEELLSAYTRISAVLLRLRF